jgi:antitoxin component YwqK of YwqJK toxin-antitoxin module
MKMKTPFLLPILLLSLISCSSETDSMVEQTSSVVKRDGLYYEQFSDTPFTGEFIRYRANGQLYKKGSYKDGKKEGEWVEYYDNGQLFEKGNFKNGDMEGEWIWYNKDGTVYEP